MKKKLEFYKRENKNLLSSYDQWWVLPRGAEGRRAGGLQEQHEQRLGAC